MKRPIEITFVKMLPLEFPIKTCKKLSVPSYEKKEMPRPLPLFNFRKRIVKGYDTREKPRMFLIQISRNRRNHSEGFCILLV